MRCDRRGLWHSAGRLRVILSIPVTPRGTPSSCVAIARAVGLGKLVAMLAQRAARARAAWGSNSLFEKRPFGRAMYGVNVDRIVEALEHYFAKVLERQAFPDTQFGDDVGDKTLPGLSVRTNP